MAVLSEVQPHTIEPLQERDLDSVMEIERLAFRTPWSRQVFQDEITRTWAFIDVLREDASGEVRAFCNYWRVADEVHVLKVATHPHARRRGYGERLIAHIVGFARAQGARLLTLEVRRSNEEAQRLYRRFGFKAVGLRPNYYADDNEDAVVMILELS